MPSLWAHRAHGRFNKQKLLLLLYNVDWLGGRAKQKEKYSEYRVWGDRKELVNPEASRPRSILDITHQGHECSWSWTELLGEGGHCLHRSPLGEQTPPPSLASSSEAQKLAPIQKSSRGGWLGPTQTPSGLGLGPNGHKRHISLPSTFAP